MKLRLIEGWRSAWKLGSVQLAAAVAAISFVLTLNPAILIGLITFIPAGPLQWATAAFVALFVFVIPAASRLLRKTPPEVCPEPETADAAK